MNEFMNGKEETVKRAQNLFEKMVSAKTIDELEFEYNNYVAEIVFVRNELSKSIHEKNEIENQSKSADMKEIMKNMILKFVNAGVNKKLGDTERNMLNIAGFSDEEINPVLYEIEKTIVVEISTNNALVQDEACEVKSYESQNESHVAEEIDNTQTVESEDIENIDILTPEISKSEDVYDDTPLYVVFYSLNNGAYIALDERLKCCVPVRNLAKAYCVPSSIDGISNGQNELSKYRLDKLKPIKLKFLTQKEYDDSIGKAMSMKALMENMPVSELNGSLSSDHKVSNFASNQKSTSSSSNHIGSKKNNDYYIPDNSYNSAYAYDDNKVDYDWLHNDAYSTGKSSNKNSQKKFSITMTQAMENPKMLYRMLHNNIDDDGGPNDFLVESYMNDIIDMQSSNEIPIEHIEDFDVLIMAINKTIYSIARTKSAWLVDCFISKQKIIDSDYMMDIDYSLLDRAIERWNNNHHDNKIMYVEDFDPTIINFKKKMGDISKKFVSQEEELISMSVYNYVRCLIAYETFTGGSAHF